MPSGYNFDPTIHKRLEISREIPQIQARHLGMEHSMLQIFPIKTSLCFAYVSSQVEPVGCGDRQLLMHRGQSKG